MTPARDRFDRIAEQEAFRDIAFSTKYAPRFAAKLLRREHAAMIRAVKRLAYENITDADTNENADWIKRQDVLALLAARKGTR